MVKILIILEIICKYKFFKVKNRKFFLKVNLLLLAIKFTIISYSNQSYY